MGELIKIGENNNVTKINIKKLFNKKNIIMLIILGVFLLSLIPISTTIKNQQIKLFDIKIKANMYAMLEICSDYMSGNIDEVQFSIQEGELMNELDKLKIPKAQILENSIFTYKTNCAYVVLQTLTTYKDGGNATLAVRDEMSMLRDTMNRVNEEVDKINKTKKVDLNYSKNINKETEELLKKIKN